MFRHLSIRAALTPRRGAAAVARGVAVLAIVSLLPTVAGAQPSDRSQDVGSLKAKAAKIAAELETLDQRTNALDEQFNNANLELAALRSKLGENRAQVDAAKASLASTRSQAQQFAVQAYVGGGEDSSMLGVSDDAADASRRRTYLATRYGNSEDVIDTLTASQKDLNDREAELQAANAEVDAKMAEIGRSKRSLETTVTDRRKLYDSVKGELAAAVQAEQDRLAREAAKAAEAEARAAAARAAAARRPQAVVVRTVRANGVNGADSVQPDAPVTRNITPPPADAPRAVQVALAQQGKPYVWAAAGPNAFDCSGLIMYAYAAAGISLPHSSRSLRAMTRSISADELQPGDLVFGGSPVHHVGLYIGNGQMVHAPHSGDVVKVSGIYGTSRPVSFGRL